MALTDGQEQAWRLERSRFEPREHRLYESLFGLSNGHLGVRATVDFDDPDSRPGSFHSRLYADGLSVRRHLVNGLNATYRAVRVDGVQMGRHQVTGFAQTLDMRLAEVRTNLRYTDDHGRSTELMQRLWLPTGHTDAIESVVVVRRVDHDAPVHLLLGVDWRPGNGDMGGVHDRVRLHHLKVMSKPTRSGDLLMVADDVGGTTRQAAAIRVTANVGQHSEERQDGRNAVVVALAPDAGNTLSTNVLATVRVGPDADRQVVSSLERLAVTPAATRVDEHRHTWQRRWDDALEISGSPEAVEAMRYGQFQLLQAMDLDHTGPGNIPARGWTSEYHSGHFFFNTELFVLPYCSLTHPNVAREMLRFRLRGLDAARQHARDTGFVGARYPEETADDGGPTSPSEIYDPVTGHRANEMSGKQVLHLSADVLYGLARYVSNTGDEEFLAHEALPLVVECARFLADLMAPDPDTGGRGARGVMGFDEYHLAIDHHHGTNALARWGLRYAASTTQSLHGTSKGRSALERLSWSPEEASAWLCIASEIIIPADIDGVFPIFRGYMDLPDQTRLEQPNHRLPALAPADQDRADRLESFSTRLTKQADVVFTMILLPDEYDLASIARNLDFYEPRTAHESSLSMTAHGIAAAWTGDRDLATRMWLASARYNLDFVPRDDYSNGVHLAAFSGAWLILVIGFLGVREDGGALAIDPSLPVDVDRLRVPLRWRDHRVVVTLDRNAVEVSADSSNTDPIEVSVEHMRQLVEPGAASRWPRGKGNRLATTPRAQT